MGLKQYLTDHGVTITRFAEDGGWSRSSLCNWVYGVRAPRFATAQKISDMTGGKVTVLELLATGA